MKNAALPKARFVTILFAVVVMFFSSAVFGETEAESRYRLGSGDKVYVTVFGQ